MFSAGVSGFIQTWTPKIDSGDRQVNLLDLIVQAKVQVYKKQTQSQSQTINVQIIGGNYKRSYRGKWVYQRGGKNQKSREVRTIEGWRAEHDNLALT